MAGIGSSRRLIASVRKVANFPVSLGGVDGDFCGLRSVQAEGRLFQAKLRIDSEHFLAQSSISEAGPFLVVEVTRGRVVEVMRGRVVEVMRGRDATRAPDYHRLMPKAFRAVNARIGIGYSYDSSVSGHLVVSTINDECESRLGRDS